MALHLDGDDFSNKDGGAGSSTGIADILDQELAERSPEISGVAATCLGHLARIHGMLDLDRVEPMLRELRRDPEVGVRAQDALDDIQQYMGPDG